jgi:multidrug efflux pump subunit AcrB
LTQLIGLSGILMPNTLILNGQIHTNQDESQTPYQAIIEATVQRARPVILTALAAVLAFIPLTLGARSSGCRHNPAFIAF